MSDRPAADALSALLERFSLDRAGGKTLDQVQEAQVQLLFARIAALTDLLRRTPPDEAAPLAARLLLRELAEVAAHFRGRANVLRPSLAAALAQLGDALSRGQPPAGE